MDRPPTLDWACIFCHESSLFFQPDMEAQDKLIYRCTDCLAAYPFQWLTAPQPINT